MMLISAALAPIASETTAKQINTSFLMVIPQWHFAKPHHGKSMENEKLFNKEFP
jgi:hypothetical protein